MMDGRWADCVRGDVRHQIKRTTGKGTGDKGKQQSNATVESDCHLLNVRTADDLIGTHVPIT